MIPFFQLQRLLESIIPVVRTALVMFCCDVVKFFQTLLCEHGDVTVLSYKLRKVWCGV